MMVIILNTLTLSLTIDLFQVMVFTSHNLATEFVLNTLQGALEYFVTSKSGGLTFPDRY
jgi:hypothetical protein